MATDVYHNFLTTTTLKVSLFPRPTPLKIFFRAQVSLSAEFNPPTTWSLRLRQLTNLLCTSSISCSFSRVTRSISNLWRAFISLTSVFKRLLSSSVVTSLEYAEKNWISANNITSFPSCKTLTLKTRLTEMEFSINHQRLRTDPRL